MGVPPPKNTVSTFGFRPLCPSFAPLRSANRAAASRISARTIWAYVSRETPAPSSEAV